ncbi:MAG: DUF4369 domain-containing protein [Bacteroidales bacterium]|nr:DUF4369 domain-containing protein [Bacteroidales bacterium]
MRTLTLILTALCLMMLGGCSEKKYFTVEGTVDGGRTMNLRFIYVGEDRLNNVITAARDGKFVFRGEAPRDGALVQVLDNDYRRLAVFYAKNGEKINLKVNADDPVASQATGTDILERWNEWTAANKAVLKGLDARARNKALAKYVGAHKDDLLSTLLVAAYYDSSVDPQGAVTLLESIKPEVRPQSVVELMTANSAMRDEKGGYNKVMPFRYFSSETDSMATFRADANRRTLLVFTAGATGRDSIMRALHELNDEKGAKAAILDIRFDVDTLMWKRDLRGDSVDWPSAWMPEATANPSIERLGITSVPFFIVADSAGTQLYHGPALTPALKAARQR